MCDDFIAGVCVNGWSQWYNRDKPDTGDGDREALTPSELAAFCGNGRINSIECVTTDGNIDYLLGCENIIIFMFSLWCNRQEFLLIWTGQMYILSVCQHDEIENIQLFTKQQNFRLVQIQSICR